MARVTKAEQAESLAGLHTYLPKGTTVTAVRRHHTSNGTTWVDFYTFKGDSKVERVSRAWLSFHIARALGLPFDEKRGCVRLPFMNMDPAFNTVYALASRLHGDGYALHSEWL